jgi:hypothetical protein
MKLDHAKIEGGPLPLADMLKGSLYYPAAGFDGRPVAELGGQIHSFVYVDYGVRRDVLFDQLNSNEDGFKGYEILGWREVKQDELVPTGWQPEVVPGPQEDPSRRPFDGESFGVWVVLERAQSLGSAHGPERFSLLYLCADGAAAYQALYNANESVPSVLAIIQPGTGFGGNYTDFTDPKAILARSVWANRTGLPSLLLHGGIGGRKDYTDPIWPMYGVDGGWLNGHSIRAWSLAWTDNAWRESETLGRRNPFEWCRSTDGSLLTRRPHSPSVAGKFSYYEYRRVIDLVRENGEQGTPLGASPDRPVPAESVGALLTDLRNGSSAVRPLSSHLAAIARDEGYVIPRQGRGVWLRPSGRHPTMQAIGSTGVEA